MNIYEEKYKSRHVVITISGDARTHTGQVTEVRPYGIYDLGGTTPEEVPEGEAAAEITVVIDEGPRRGEPVVLPAAPEPNPGMLVPGLELAEPQT